MPLATNEKRKFANTINTGVGTLNAATAGALGADTNGVAVLTAGSNGTIVESLVFSSDDTAAVNVFVYGLSGATVRPIGIVNVPASSGNSGTVANVDALANTGVTLIGACINENGKRIIPLEANEVLKISCLANMTAAKKCHGSAVGFDI